MSPNPILLARSAGGELRAYGRKVRAWSTGLLTRYVMAMLLLLAALAGLIGVIAVGLGALFHFLDVKYGTWIAYASIDGLLIVLTMVAAASGLAKFRQELPAPPSPGGHAKAASRIVAAQGMATLATSGRTLAARPVLPAAIGLASVGLLGWLIASRLNNSKTHILEPE